MTTTSVKDVGSVMNLGAQASKTSAKGSAGGFQAVWNQQTNDNRTATQENSQTGKAGKAQNKSDKAVKPGDDLKAKDKGQKDLAALKPEKVDTNAAEMTDDELEAAMETVATVVSELIGQIAQTYDIPVEAVQEFMTDMNLQPLDLLQPENLSNLLLEAGGAQDSLSLLTNEQLYSDYQALMEQGKAVLEECSKALNVDPEELQQLAARQATPEALFGQTTVQTETAASDEETALPKAEISIQTQKDAPAKAREDVEKPEEKAEDTDIRSQDIEKVSAEEADVREDQNDQETGRGDQMKQETGHSKAEKKPVHGEGNLVLQTMKEDNFQIQTQEAQSAAAGRDVTDTQNLMRQIMDFMKIQVKADVSTMEMQLHPANLGTLQIHVLAKGGVLTANFITQNEAVKAALESQMVQLKESFEEQGVKVEAIEVTVQTHQFEQNLEQGRGRQPQGQTEAKRARTRRISLDGLNGTELPEDLEAEDRLTAEMMAANGTTVDFTA